MACQEFRLDMHATQFGMCKCGHPRAAHTLSRVMKRKKSAKKLMSKRTSTRSQKLKKKEKKKIVVSKKKDKEFEIKGEPDSIFNDEDVSTVEVPSIFETRSPPPSIQIARVVHQEDIVENKDVKEVMDDIVKENEDEDDLRAKELVVETEELKTELIETEERETEERETEKIETEDTKTTTNEKEEIQVDRSDSLNMQEIYLISKESNSLFEGLLQNNNAEDEEEEEESTNVTTTPTLEEEDKRRSVEWGSAFTSGSSRMSQLEAENKTLRRRLVMTASKVRSLEVELALASSKRKRKSSTNATTTTTTSTKDVLEEVCKKLLGSGFHQSRVRQALRVLVRVDATPEEEDDDDSKNGSFMGAALKSLTVSTKETKLTYLNGGGLGSASEDDEEDEGFENQDEDDEDERKGLNHLNWISNEDESRNIFGTSRDRRGRASMDKASLLNRLVKREDVAKLFEGIEIEQHVDREKERKRKAATERPLPSSQESYRKFLKCLARPEMRLIRRQMDSFVNKMLDERVTKGSAARKLEVHISLPYLSFHQQTNTTTGTSERVRRFLSGMEMALKTNEWSREWLALDTEYGAEVAAEGLERCVTSRLTPRIFNRSRRIRAADQKLWRRTRLLAQFVRPEHLDMCDAFRNDETFMIKCRKEMVRMDSYNAPVDKLACVVNTCQFIFTKLSEIHKSGKSNTPPGADDFFPPFVFVVLTSNVPRLHAHIEHIQTYRRQEDLIGKAGYCFVNLCSAVAFIETLTAKELTIDPNEFEKKMDISKKCLEKEDSEEDLFGRA